MAEEAEHARAAKVRTNNMMHAIHNPPILVALWDLYKPAIILEREESQFHPTLLLIHPLKC
jgi:hypothetical protein